MKNLIFSLMFLLLSSAQFSVSAADGLIECRNIKSDSERLACYDRLADAAVFPSENRPMFAERDSSQNDHELTSKKQEKVMQTDEILPSHSAAPSKSRSATAVVNQDVSGFGGEQFKQKKQPIGSIQTNIEGKLKSIQKNSILKLENGQIWKVVSSNRSRRFTSALDSPAVTISKGVLSSHNLKIDGQRGSYKVKRIK